MAAVRRIPAILALALVLTVVSAAPADAHPLFEPYEVGVGATVSVSLVVPAELQVPIVDVLARAPNGFRVIASSPATGWTVDPVNPLHFTGQAAAGTQPSFLLRGEATEKAALFFPTIVRGTDGSEQDWTSTDPRDPFPAPVLYAGVTPDPTAIGTKGPNKTLRNVGLGAIAAGFLLAGGYFVLRRRFFAPARGE